MDLRYTKHREVFRRYADGGDDMALDMLIQEAEGLSEEVIKQVLQYIEFLKFKSSDSSNHSCSTECGKQIIRRAGLYRGQGWMADDFDAPTDNSVEDK